MIIKKFVCVLKQTKYLLLKRTLINEHYTNITQPRNQTRLQI
jgi:hypothetical protein